MDRRNMRWTIASTLVALCVTLVAGEGAPAMAQVPAGVSVNGVFIDTQAAPGARAPAVAALAAKAMQRGRVRVIVGLNLSMRPPHELSETEAAGQQLALRGAQRSVVSRVIGVATPSAAVTEFDHIPFMAMNVTAAQLNSLAADPGVVSIQEDVPVPPLLTQSVPFIRAPQVWSAGFTGAGVAVAILDTGVDKTHDMFPGNKIASEACYSTTDGTYGSTSVCPGGVPASTAVGSGVNCPYPTIEGCAHGTHVAGIAAGNMASPVLRGVAKDARIIAIQVFSRFNSATYCSSPPCVLSFTSDQIKGLQRVYALRKAFTIAAVNMSLGGGQYFGPCDTSNTAEKAAIDLLRAARIATVIASGNNGFNGSMSSPACISSAIAVGSTLDTSDDLSYFSNHAANVRLLAPGSNIQSSIPPGPKTTSIFNGTSMATPHVAGAFALLRDVKEGSTVDDIAAALECTGVPITRAGITEPRVNVNAARAYLLSPPNTTTTFEFNKANQAKLWSPLAGTWGITAAAPGTYRVTSDTTGYKVSTTTNCNESVRVTTRLRRVWPSGQRGIAGILFKAQLSATNATVHGYVAAIDRDLPGDDHTNNVVLWRYDGVNMPSGTGTMTLLCHANLNTITSGTYYTLRVLSAGGKHNVYVNNALACSATDYSYGTGRVGLIANYAGAPGNALWVDTFVIDPNEVVPANSVAGPDVAFGQ